MSEPPSVRAATRILEEMDRKNLSQTDIAGILKWSPSDVSKRLHGSIKLTVDDMAALCFAVGISATEAVRDHGLEFCAEMTPTEMRLLDGYRKLTPELQHAHFRTITNNVPIRVESRGALREKKIPRGRG